MAKILLLDFGEKESKFLSGKKYDVETKETNWVSGRTESLVPPTDCQIVFYQMEPLNPGKGLHNGDAKAFEGIVKEGGAIVSFIGHGEEYHLTNVIGSIPRLKFDGNEHPEKVIGTADKLFSLLFSEYGPSIQCACELFAEELGLDQKIDLTTWDSASQGEIQILAKSYRNRPVAALIRREKGFCLLLPSFGEKNVEVTEWLLSKAMPELAPHLYAEVSPESTEWMESYEYYFPHLKEIFQQVEDETEKYRRTIENLRIKIDYVRKHEQEPYNKLLKAQGEELRQAVINAFKYLEWKNVIDVDSYWKHVIHIKEEDIWLLDENDQGSIEEKIRKDQMLLVVIRTSDSAASDSDCDVLQKYKGRRMQEFNNTKMKAVLLGNYFCKKAPKSRQNPFSGTQMDEAVKDSNGLLTTYELFKAIKAEKENMITKEEIRNQIKNKAGLIVFEYPKPS